MKLLWVASGSAFRSAAANVSLVSVAGSGVTSGRIAATASSSTPPLAGPSLSRAVTSFFSPRQHPDRRFLSRDGGGEKDRVARPGAEGSSGESGIVAAGDQRIIADHLAQFGELRGVVRASNGARIDGHCHRLAAIDRKTQLIVRRIHQRGNIDQIVRIIDQLAARARPTAQAGDRSLPRRRDSSDSSFKTFST